MSPIEHVWDKLGRSVRKRLTLQSTLLNLRQLLEEWVRIPQRYIQTLINSMRRRCTACRYARGVPQNIYQIKWCLLKNNSCFINN